MVNFDDPLPPPPGLLKSYQAIDIDIKKINTFVKLIKSFYKECAKFYILRI